MDTHDSADSNAHGSSGGGSFPHPNWAGGSDAAAGPRSGRRTIIGRLARDWWRILLFWWVISTPLVYLIYTLEEPTFEASSLLMAEPTTIDLYDGTSRATPNLSEVKPYLLTQVSLLTSNSVLDAALADPAIRELSMIRSFKDPKAELRQEMRVEIIGENTFMIQVTLAARDPYQAAKIVNAVVDAYIEQHNRYHLTKNRSLKLNLENELRKLDQRIKDIQNELAKLVETANVSVSNRLVTERDDEVKDGAVASSMRVVTEEQYNDMTDRLLQADFEQMDAECGLRRPSLPGARHRPKSSESWSLPSRRRSGKGSATGAYVARVKVESRPPNTEMSQAALTQDLVYLTKLREAVKQRLSQLEFDIGQESYRVTLQDKAQVPQIASNNKRIKYMAAAPVGVLFLILGLFLVREFRATRVAEPEAMS